MTGKAAARRSKRRHGSTPRDKRLAVLFNAAEFEAVRAAADADGMLPSAWVGKLATDAAASTPGDAIAARRLDRALAEMAKATELARRHGYLHNQPVARLNAIGEHDGRLVAAADLVARSVTAMEDAVLAAARAIRPLRPPK